MHSAIHNDDGEYDEDDNNFVLIDLVNIGIKPLGNLKTEAGQKFGKVS